MADSPLGSWGEVRTKGGGQEDFDMLKKTRRIREALPLSSRSCFSLWQSINLQTVGSFLEECHTGPTQELGGGVCRVSAYALSSACLLLPLHLELQGAPLFLLSDVNFDLSRCCLLYPLYHNLHPPL